jgi:hypothetical protein
MTDRVSINARVSDAQQVASIISLVQHGQLKDAWERFQGAAVKDGALARLGYDINAALVQEPVAFQVTNPPTIAVGGKTQWFQAQPNVPYVIQATTPSQIGCSVGSGSEWVWGSVGRTAAEAAAFTPVEGKTSRGTGAPGRLAIKVGEFYAAKHESATVKDMRITAEAP